MKKPKTIPKQFTQFFQRSKHEEKRNSILAAVALSVVGVVLAVNHGRYFCDNCSTAPSKEDILIFVRHYVNKDVNIWRVGDTFDLCNGSICARLINARPDASVFGAELVYPDPGVGYKRSGSVVGGYNPPLGPINVGYPPGGGDPGGVVIVEPLCPPDDQYNCA